MFRAPFVALLALVAGAAVACSDTVPPPGATLSGFVYYDANANGVRDSCDDGDVDLFVTVELYTGDPDGPRFTARTDTDRRWRIGNVPRGEYLLALEPPLSPVGEFFWLTTGPATPIELSVKGYEAIDGLDIGVAYRRFSHLTTRCRPTQSSSRTRMKTARPTRASARYNQSCLPTLVPGASSSGNTASPRFSKSTHISPPKG